MAPLARGVVNQLAAFLARTQHGLKGFTRRNLFRMRQSPLVSQFHPDALSIFKDRYVLEFHFRGATTPYSVSDEASAGSSALVRRPAKCTHHTVVATPKAATA